jgi:hypothetical protein
MKKIQKILIAVFGVILAVTALWATNLSAPQSGNIVSGSPNVTVSGGVSSPTAISVSANQADNGGVTFIGLTNTNSPLIFPFMNALYYGRLVINSEAWTGLTNGVYHWRGDGANPTMYCTSPREFWFQTNINWVADPYPYVGMSNVVWSNDVFKLNSGTMRIECELTETCYGQGPPVSSVAGQEGWYMYAFGSNGNVQTSGDNGGEVPYPINSHQEWVSPQCSNFSHAMPDGSVIIVLTNFNPGTVGPYPDLVVAERITIHCVELTTGTNWPFH